MTVISNTDTEVPEILKTGIGNARNVQRYMFGDGKLSELESLLKAKRLSKEDYVIYYIDEFFRDERSVLSRLPIEKNDQIDKYKNNNNDIVIAISNNF